jgi:hypothetical protein
MLAHDTLNRVAAEPRATIAHEQRRGIGAGALVEPSVKNLHTVFPEWRRALLASLAHASHVGAGAERNIATGQID